MVQPPSIFGEIPGFPPGVTFDTRREVREAGLHRHDMAGISGNYEEGADAIVISGGYVDDRDDGDSIIYTGQGGQDDRKRQVRDQTLTKGNLALARAEEQGVPIRVIRGSQGDRHQSPAQGYRYDGLYTVTSHWQEPSVDGPLVWRFTMEKVREVLWSSASGSGGSSTPTPPSSTPPSGTPTPPRQNTVIQRVVRNTAVAQWVKEIHEHACQVCREVLRTPAGRYAEGAHIRPLGEPHNGPDVPENILCLCPNHHVLLDKGAIYIDNDMVRSTLDKRAVGRLRKHPRHKVAVEYTDYHRRTFARG